MGFTLGIKAELEKIFSICPKLLINAELYGLGSAPRVFLFFDEFSQPGHQKKKKAGESDKGIFEVLKNKIAISWPKKLRNRQI